LGILWSTCVALSWWPCFLHSSQNGSRERWSSRIRRHTWPYPLEAAEPWPCHATRGRAGWCGQGCTPGHRGQAFTRAPLTGDVSGFACDRRKRTARLCPTRASGVPPLRDRYTPGWAPRRRWREARPEGGAAAGSAARSTPWPRRPKGRSRRHLLVRIREPVAHDGVLHAAVAHEDGEGHARPCEHREEIRPRVGQLLR
jgi:hypothetical protein